MTIVTRVEPNGPVTCFIAGSIHVTHLHRLKQAVRDARRDGRAIELDLSEVTLIERVCLDYLVAMRDVTLVNCPSYVEPWLRPAP